MCIVAAQHTIVEHWERGELNINERLKRWSEQVETQVNIIHWNMGALQPPQSAHITAMYLYQLFVYSFIYPSPYSTLAPLAFVYTAQLWYCAKGHNFYTNMTRHSQPSSFIGINTYWLATLVPQMSTGWSRIMLWLSQRHHGSIMSPSWFKCPLDVFQKHLQSVTLTVSLRAVWLLCDLETYIKNPVCSSFLLHVVKDNHVALLYWF